MRLVVAGDPLLELGRVPLSGALRNAFDLDNCDAALALGNEVVAPYRTIDNVEAERPECRLRLRFERHTRAREKDLSVAKRRELFLLLVDLLEQRVALDLARREVSALGTLGGQQVSGGPYGELEITGLLPESVDECP